MTSPDPSAQSGAADPAQSGGVGSGDSGAAQPASGTQSGPPAATTTDPDTAQLGESELEKQRSRTRAADQRAALLEAELKQLKDKDLPLIDKLQRDLAEQAKVTEKHEAELRQARIHNAFLTDNEYDWHNPDRALKSIDLGGVDIDKDGNVSGLKAAIAKLAKEEPYLLKPKDDSAGKGDTPPNATPPMNAGAPGSDKPNRQESLRRFPAMRTRTGGV